MAYALCQYNPSMRITVCELPSVVNCAQHFKPSLDACPNQGNVSFVPSDFFQSDLPKADLYVISRTLHNWSDENVDLILSKVFKSLHSGMHNVYHFLLCTIKLQFAIDPFNNIRGLPLDCCFFTQKRKHRERKLSKRK